MVRSEEVWKVHLNAKQHKENVIKARELKEKVERQASGTAVKRPASAVVEDPVPEKKPKGILKNSSAIPHPPQPLPASKDPPATATATEPVTEMEVTEDATLPEGFFDDPKKDAIARNLEYKDPVLEEWERFQKEIKEEATVSNEIIAEDQEESTAERQIVEIDEQMRNWDRVLAMEKMKEERLKRLKEAPRKAKVPVPVEEEADDDSDAEKEGSDGELDDFGSWRAKGWKKSD